MTRTFPRGLAVAVALTVVTATAALAHPAFNPNRLPAGEAVDAVLVVPHGCDPEEGMPEDGASSPTVLVDLQLAPEVSAFEAHELEGWEVEHEEDVVRWTATDGGTTDPIQFPVTVTIDGPVDEPIHLSAFQECEEGSFRWIGTPDREAEYPAVKLTPTQGEIGAESPDDGHVPTEDHEEHDDHDDHAGNADDATPGPDVAAADEQAEAAADSGVSWVVVAVVALVLLAGLAVWVLRSRGGRA